MALQSGSTTTADDGGQWTQKQRAAKRIQYLTPRRLASAQLLSFGHRLADCHIVSYVLLCTTPYEQTIVPGGAGFLLTQSSQHTVVATKQHKRCLTERLQHHASSYLSPGTASSDPKSQCDVYMCCVRVNWRDEPNLLCGLTTEVFPFVETLFRLCGCKTTLLISAACKCSSQNAAKQTTKRPGAHV